MRQIPKLSSQLAPAQSRHLADHLRKTYPPQRATIDPGWAVSSVG